MIKFLMLWELDWEDQEKARDLGLEIGEELKKGSDKFPKRVIGSGILSTTLPKLTKEVQGFTIYETDDWKQIRNMRQHYTPFMKTYFIPIVLVTTAVIVVDINVAGCTFTPNSYDIILISQARGRAKGKCNRARTVNICTATLRSCCSIGY